MIDVFPFLALRVKGGARGLVAGVSHSYSAGVAVAREEEQKTRGRPSQLFFRLSPLRPHTPRRETLS